MTLGLFEAVTRLASVLSEENEALKRLDFPAAIALGRAKEAALLGVTQGRTPTPATDHTPALAALGRRVGSLAVENRQLLERAIAVQSRIVGIVARAGTPPSASGQYGPPNGYRTQPRRAAYAMALSSRA